MTHARTDDNDFVSNFNECRKYTTNLHFGLSSSPASFQPFPSSVLTTTALALIRCSWPVHIVCRSIWIVLEKEHQIWFDLFQVVGLRQLDSALYSGWWTFRTVDTRRNTSDHGALCGNFTVIVLYLACVYFIFDRFGAMWIRWCSLWETPLTPKYPPTH